MKAIILDGQLKSALTAVRSLGTQGIRASVGSERSTGMALHSRYAKESFVYPSPYFDQKGFIASLKNEAERLGGKPVVFSFSDATYLSLYTYRKELAPYVTLVFPSPKSVEIAFDKAATYSLARISGIPTITTYTPEMQEEVEVLSTQLTYPVVLKTRRSVTWNNGVGIFGSASFIHSEKELSEKFRDLKETLLEAPLIQELLLGEEYGVEMLARDGKIYASVAHHRMRSLSPTGGASVLKETLEDGELKHTLVGYSERLVKELMWSGPIMIEFKVDSDSRKPYLMEINGRFWGSLPLAVVSGVDMPLLYFKELTENKIPEEIVTGREGVVSNHFLGDVRHLMRVFFARDAMRKILYPNRLKALREFLVLPLGTKSDVWSFFDPKPSLMEFVDVFNRIYSSSTRK